jgi:hypothetical protein
MLKSLEFAMWKSFSKKLDGFATFCLFLWPPNQGIKDFENGE